MNPKANAKLHRVLPLQSPMTPVEIPGPSSGFTPLSSSAAPSWRSEADNLPLKDIRRYYQLGTQPRTLHPPIPPIKSLFAKVQGRGFTMLPPPSLQASLSTPIGSRVLLGKRAREEMTEDGESPCNTHLQGSKSPQKKPRTQTHTLSIARLIDQPQEQSNAEPPMQQIAEPNAQNIPQPSAMRSGQATPLEKKQFVPLRSVQVSLPPIAKTILHPSLRPGAGPGAMESPQQSVDTADINQRDVQGIVPTTAQNTGQPSGQPGYGCFYNSPQYPQLPMLTVPYGTANPQNVMWVSNMWQNVYYPPQLRPLHAPPPFALSHQVPVAWAPQRSSTNKTVLRSPPQRYSDEKTRIYDLAKIRRLRFTVLQGTVYNQQNHPMCAAPRENGQPCKRNISRSPCRWHGENAILTHHNTKNGVLDEHGNLVSVGAPMARLAPATPGPSQHGGLSLARPILPKSTTPPKVVSRNLRWNNEEHYWFLLGLKKYGHKWSVISKIVGTRNTLQVQSHAQKFFERQQKEDKKKSTIHDLKMDSPEMTAIADKYTDADRKRRLFSSKHVLDGKASEKSSVTGNPS